MRNILVFTSIIACLLLFASCGNESNQAETNESISQEDYYLDLAKNAKSYAEVYDILKRNDSKEFQISLANLDNDIVQEALLNYDNLSSDALVTVCENPCSKNINFYQVKQFFESAIYNAELTAEQEIRIAQTKKLPMQEGVLYRKNLSAEALVYLLDSNNTCYSILNLNYCGYQESIKEKILRTEFTLEQKEKLLELDINIVTSALKQKETL